MGELGALFEHATVVFMGGTLASRGGHNILEPAYFGKPVIAGPHMENFAAIAEEFTSGGGLVRIARADALAPAVARLLDHPDTAAAIGRQARALAMAKRGAVESTVKEIFKAADDGVPAPLRTLPARVFLTPLSWIWTAGHRRNLARGMASQRALETKVISVGGLTMGGAGKSPMVEYLAERLDEAGRNPAILTRGYRKKSAAPMVVTPRGEKAAVELTGDEAQVFVRAGHAHVGIGSDRFAVGRQMEQTLHPGVFLLDDGFQHFRLKRDQDLVLIDALDPLAGGMFPLGRRREPLESLARATAVIVTRLDPGQGTEGIERLVRRYNSRAPVFRSHVVPLHWIDFEWDRTHALNSRPFGPVAAFCGLGSPRSFWHTLEALGVEVVFRWAFGDHHAYRPAELRRLAVQASAAGAQALVTTEKDIMNLCQNASELLQPHKLFWLKIGVEIENEQELLRRIL
jgi:tetraacyldisaccharide 4'-kinase